MSLTQKQTVVTSSRSGGAHASSVSSKKKSKGGATADANPAINNESEWGCVTIIRENDVLLGRGSRSNQPGNVKFRQLIKDNRFRYLAASKVDKPKISEDVVKQWRSMNPPGRFLSRKDEDEVEGNSEKKDEHAVWFDVGDKKARLKTSMALRERTPEAVQYLQVIRKQENEETQRGTMYVKQQLGGKAQDHPEQNFSEGNALHLSPPQSYASRRANFAGFSHQHANPAMHQHEHQHAPMKHPSMLHHPVPPPPMVLPQAPPRSSLMGEREAQVYMMHQHMEAEQRRLDIEMRLPAMSGHLSHHHLPSIPDQTESDHTESGHSSEDSTKLTQAFPSQYVSSSSTTNTHVPQGISSSCGPLDMSLHSFDLSSHKERGVDYADLASVPAHEFEDSEDAITVEKYRTLLQGWAEGEKQTCASSIFSDADDGMESIVKSPRSPRRRGVGRNMSGCSVQSTLSDLMAMSIISSGADDDCVGVERPVLPEMVYFD